jgi:hypothetical protein
MQSRDHSWLHGDEHLTPEPSDRENKEQFYILLRDIVTNANYLEKVNMFTPDSDDMETIEALHDFMDYHLQRALEKDFKDSRAREALEDNN